jgi:hypothetical protein
MGLLDDAIREHLDLKRRRGADPTEVERAEREALGPVRRAQAGQDADADPAAEPQVPADFGDGEAYEDMPDLDHPSDFPEDAESHDPGEAEDDSWTFAEEPPPAAQPPSVGQETAVHAPVFDDEAEEPFEGPVEPPTAPPQARGTGGETVEYDIESELGPEHPEDVAEGGEKEDVLEETPEFLQDTPDHDRLWFEQRPPKDFDFDG